MILRTLIDDLKEEREYYRTQRKLFWLYTILLFTTSSILTFLILSSLK